MQLKETSLGAVLRALLLSFIVFVPLTRAQTEPRGRHVILVVLDQVSATSWSQSASCPGLDDWQKLGTRFGRALAQSDGLAGGRAALLAEEVELASGARPFEHLRSRFDGCAVLAPEASEFFPAASVTRRIDDAEVALNTVKEIFRAGPSGQFVALHLRDTAMKFGRGRDEIGRATRLSCCLALFLDWFRKEPAFAETLVIVVGDRALDARSSARVPLWMSGLGLGAGVDENRLGLAQIDVMPTIFDFVGLAWPETIGRSVYELLETRPERDLVCRSASGHLADDVEVGVETIGLELQASDEVCLRRGRFKVVHDRRRQAWSLFDDLVDPEGSQDLATQMPEILREMQGRVEHWMRLQSWRLLSRRMR